MPQTLKLYIAFVVAGGLSLLPAVLFNLSWNEQLGMLSFLGVIAGILDRYPLILPDHQFYSISLAFSVFVLFAVGGWEAVYVELVISFISIVALKMNGLRSLFHVARRLIGIFLAGLVVSYGFGVQTEEFSALTLLGIPVAVAIYQLSNLIFVRNAFLKKPKNFSLDVSLSREDSPLSFLMNVGISMLLFYLYLSSGLVGFLLIVLLTATVVVTLRHAFNRFIQLRETYIDTLEQLMPIRESHSGRDSGHANRIGFISREIAASLRLSQEDVDEIHYAALLHDIGKEYLPPRLFRKPTSFTVNEEKEYRKHAEVGADVIKEITGLSRVMDYVYYHHEHWDGSGYPEGLQKEEIPLGARIIRLANEYDHIMQDKSIFNKKENLQRMTSTVLDPELAAYFLRTFNFETLYERKDTEEKEAGIFEQPVLNQAKKQYEDSLLLEGFRMYQSVTYKNGRFMDHLERETVVPMEERLRNILEEHRFSSKNYHEFLEDKDTKTVYDAHFVMMSDSIHVLIFDVTHILTYDKQQEERVRALYRDVIFAVTQGKLLLQEPGELDCDRGDKLFDLPIRKKEDVGKVRETFGEMIAPPLLSKKEVYFLKLCLSEVTTNVLKHAKHGRARAYKENDMIRVVVNDNGDGIALEDLPKSALCAGYSSQKSLGHGYHLLLKFADRILLSTSSEGTIVIIEKKIDKTSEGALINFEQRALI